ncbi:MAG TPA: DUF4914 family protein [Terracidiphilus sp.]|jgi:hypothetical protein|nr:DUF4914 family protein [Terracidiphilus sp.]
MTTAAASDRVIDFQACWTDLDLPPHVCEVLAAAPLVQTPENRPQLLDWALGRSSGTTDWTLGNRGDHGVYEAVFHLPGRHAGSTRIVEAVVTKARNGLAINFPDPAMRRRDPDAMLIGDALPTDKPRYEERFGEPFDGMRQQTLDWLKTQELVALPFYAGTDSLGYGSLLIVPRQAAFFAAALADLQGMIARSQVPADFKVTGGVLFVAPPFRHTHFAGRQIVVHDRGGPHQEVFAYNLYPGPSAKKGVYSMLLDIGEREGWTTNHCAAVAVVTPYENQLVLMHEGASGGGKSEMTEHIHRMEDGRLLIGENVVTHEQRTLNLPEACHLRPIADDMACAHPKYQGASKRLTIADAENAWFVRVDHIHSYGTAPNLERLCIDPPEPLLFLNHYIVPGGTCLTWEHVEDAPGKLCPNPRVILPRRMIEDIAAGPRPVDVRSFGVRCPPTHQKSKLYGILGMMHVLSPALAWLWRLVAPRGHANPSINPLRASGLLDKDSGQESGMESEGVGSYWAFATGRRVDQANLLLRQIVATPETRYVLLPNQHIGAWRVGYMAEWIAREYLARRGSAKFGREQVAEAPFPLLGYIPNQLRVEGSMIPRVFLRVEEQIQGGPEVYEEGARQWREFFARELKPFLIPDLDPLGHRIIEACLDGATQEDYRRLIAHPMFREDEG